MASAVSCRFSLRNCAVTITSASTLSSSFRAPAPRLARPVRPPQPHTYAGATATSVERAPHPIRYGFEYRLHAIPQLIR